MRNAGGSAGKKISVVIPAYNENGIIVETIKQCLSYLKGIEHEIIVADDGSNDGTYETVKEFAREHNNVKIVNYGRNQGKGFAIRYGFKHTTGDMVAFIDADMNIHPSQILTYVNEIERTDADVVVASKRHPDSNINYPVKRKILSDIYYMFIWILFRLNVKDTQTGLKLYKRKVLDEVYPIVLVKRYAFDIEVLANANRLGYKIIEMPVEINMDFDSKVNKRAIWNMFVDTCAVFYRMNIIHYYDRKMDLIKNGEISMEFEKMEHMQKGSIKAE